MWKKKEYYLLMYLLSLPSPCPPFSDICWWCVPFQQNWGQNWKLGNADFSKSIAKKSGLAHGHKETTKQNWLLYFGTM
ncbi:rCG58321 [Rattus norvegicus]|uniref:RCG58321 n=1 Tax=Rattus norvegicus TaxID=10116 RepID=A6J3T6_RAT|nr:rCG58321 [Rattus norvegicus]